MDATNTRTQMLEDLKMRRNDVEASLYLINRQLRTFGDYWIKHELRLEREIQKKKLERLERIIATHESGSTILEGSHGL